MTRAPQTSGQTWIFAAASVIAVLALLPVLVTRYLPLHDYPFHLARIVILAQLNNPFLARFYQQGSFLLPNMGMDAVAVPLSPLFGPEQATRIFVDFTLLTPLLGVMLLHRAAHGRFSAWPLLAVLFLHNGIFRFGFFNYLFGMGLALAAAALWMVLRPGLTRFASALVLAILLLWCHFEAFAVFALICGGVEIQRAWETWRRAGPGRATLELALAAAPFVTCLVLFILVSPTAGVVGKGFGYTSGLLSKPLGGLFSLSSGNLWLDGLSVLALAALGGALFVTRNLTFSKPLAIAAAMMALAFLAVPSDVMSALYADVRLGPALALLVIAALDIRAGAPVFVGRAIMASAVLLAVVRASVLVPEWQGYDSQIAAIVAPIGAIPPGSTLFTATADEYPALIADTPERRALWQPPLKHVASFAVLGSPLFVPMTWANPRQQPLAVRPAYWPVYLFQDNPRLVRSGAALNVWIGDIQKNLESGQWPDLGRVYLLVMGASRLEPLTLPAYVSRTAQGERFVLLRFNSPAK